jgi:biotin carboxyl carrier protein
LLAGRFTLQIKKMDTMKLKLKIENQTFNVELGNLNTSPVLASVDGETFEVYIEESERRSTASASAISLATAAVAVEPVMAASTPAPASGGPRVVTAPIPGTIIGVSVKVGDSVEYGQELCTLEAMKMKNIIRATRAGKIGVIHISKSDKVRQGQPLLEYSE